MGGDSPNVLESSLGGFPSYSLPLNTPGPLRTLQTRCEHLEKKKRQMLGDDPKNSGQIYGLRWPFSCNVYYFLKRGEQVISQLLHESKATYNSSLTCHLQLIRAFCFFEFLIGLIDHSLISFGTTPSNCQHKEFYICRGIPKKDTFTCHCYWMRG